MTVSINEKPPDQSQARKLLLPVTGKNRYVTVAIVRGGIALGNTSSRILSDFVRM